MALVEERGAPRQEVACYDGEKRRLRGNMGWGYLYAMATHAIIGPYLVMSYFWYSMTGSSISLAFILVGLICIPIGLVYGELTSMYPRAGGSFMYIKKAFGSEASFWVAWILLLSYFALMAFNNIAISSLIVSFWTPSLGSTGTIVIALLLNILIFFALSRQIDLSAKANFYLFISGTGIGFGYLILFVLSPQWSPSNWSPFFAFGPNGFITATALMVTMYFGFELIPQFTEESSYPREKQWNVTLAAILTAMVFYVFVALGETGMAPLDFILNGLQVHNFVGAQLAEISYGKWLSDLIVISSILVMTGAMIGFYLGSSRMIYAMGREHVLPSKFRHLNAHNQPVIANVAILLVTGFLIINGGSGWISDLWTLMAVGVAIAYTVVCLAFIKLRIVEKKARPWSAPGGKKTGVIATICSAFIVYNVVAYFTVGVWVLFIGFIAVGLIIRAILEYERRKYPEHFCGSAEEK